MFFLSVDFLCWNPITSNETHGSDLSYLLSPSGNAYYDFDKTKEWPERLRHEDMCWSLDVFAGVVYCVFGPHSSGRILVECFQHRC